MGITSCGGGDDRLIIFVDHDDQEDYTPPDDVLNSILDELLQTIQKEGMKVALHFKALIYLDEHFNFDYFKSCLDNEIEKKSLPLLLHPEPGFLSSLCDGDTQIAPKYNEIHLFYDVNRKYETEKTYIFKMPKTKETKKYFRRLSRLYTSLECEVPARTKLNKELVSRYTKKAKEARNEYR